MSHSSRRSRRSTCRCRWYTRTIIHICHSTHCKRLILDTNSNSKGVRRARIRDAFGHTHLSSALRLNHKLLLFDTRSAHVVHPRSSIHT
jgi:hypothetical protein